MKIACYGGAGFASNCYLLTDDSETACLVVDPSVDVAAVTEARGKELPPVQAILLTHAHFDHMLALADWREKTRAPLAVHEADAPALLDADKNLFRLFTGQDICFSAADILLHEGDSLPCGEEGLCVMHTPGHARGAVCYLCGNILLTGDTLFAGDIGRTDLYGGSSDALRQSLGRLSALSGDPAIYPGHGPSTSLAREKKYNPYLE